MYTLPYLAFMAFNNRFIRGMSYVKKTHANGKKRKFHQFSTKEKIIYTFTNGIASAIYGGLATYGLTQDYIAGIIVTAGLWIWDMLGWGKYFAAFNGRYNRKEKEFKPADIFADKISNGYLAGIVGMSIRGLMILPLFMGLAYYFSNPLIVGIGVVVGLLQGPVYGLMRILPEKYATTGAEPLMGALIGCGILESVALCNMCAIL